MATTDVAAWGSSRLLGLSGVPAEKLRALLGRAREMGPRVRAHRKGEELAGRVVANLFLEDSTRTRLSFTRAAQLLGADVSDLTSSGSSVSKGETLADTALNIAAMGVDAIVVRATAPGAASIVAGAVKCAVINAGDGKHEHPTQGLLDTYTLAEGAGRLDGFDLSGLRVLIVGDVVNSRVARSAIAAMTTLGASVVCVGPSSLLPASMASLGCEVERDFDRALDGADAVMMLRVQFERHLSRGAIASVREYRRFYALTPERAERMPPKAIIMHPGPMNRGVEIDGGVYDLPRSVILKQVTNGVAVRMAALEACVGGAS
jgi:aspartate carbamoyltransferase catalytic subunit